MEAAEDEERLAPLFTMVIVVEALTIAALWICGRIFG
jgi:hypothetical protein